MRSQSADSQRCRFRLRACPVAIGSHSLLRFLISLGLVAFAVANPAAQADCSGGDVGNVGELKSLRDLIEIKLVPLWLCF